MTTTLTTTADLSRTGLLARIDERIWELEESRRAAEITRGEWREGERALKAQRAAILAMGEGEFRN